MMIAERKRYDQFAVVYAGGIHPPLRVITPVLSALQLLKKCAPHLGWKFHYYGADDKYVLKDAERLELMDRVVIHGKVSRAEALAALKGSDMAVVVTSVSERPSLEERGIVTGKIFEAIGMGVPMLVVAPTGSDVEAIVGTAGLGNCFEAIKVEEMAAYIKDVMRGDVPARGQPEDFSWMSIARQIEEVCLNAVAV
jgi:glycosyltransferase involved in cell wall biosynthesis